MFGFRYLSVFALVPLSGLLPFGSIFIEMYFMFSSFWNYKFYYVYGFLLLVFLILVCFPDFEAAGFAQWWWRLTACLAHQTGNGNNLCYNRAHIHNPQF